MGLEEGMNSLKIELQIANQGYANWEDILNLSEYRPYLFQSLVDHYKVAGMGELRDLFRQGEVIPYIDMRKAILTYLKQYPKNMLRIYCEDLL